MDSTIANVSKDALAGGKAGHSKKKKVLLIAGAIFVMLAIVALGTGLAIGLRGDDDDNSQNNSGDTVGNTTTGNASAVAIPKYSKAQKAAIARLQRHRDLAAKLNSTALHNFFANFRSAVEPLAKALGRLPRQPISSNMLMIYITQMNVVTVQDAIADFVQHRRSLKALNGTFLKQIFKDVRLMFSEEGIRKWGQKRSAAHHKMNSTALTLNQLNALVPPELRDPADTVPLNSLPPGIPVLDDESTAAGRKLLGSYVYDEELDLFGDDIFQTGADAASRKLLQGTKPAAAPAPAKPASPKPKPKPKPSPGKAAAVARSPAKAPPKPPAKQCNTVVPIVFHVLQYRDPSGKLFPGKDNWQAAADRMVERLNIAFTNAELTTEFKQPRMDTFIRYKVHEVRADATKWRYLEVPYDNWRACGVWAKSSEFMIGIATANNANVLLHPNVYICGDYTEANPGGYANVPEKREDSKRLSDHIFINYLEADITFGTNTPEAFNGAGWILAHEVGHYMGLQHTQLDRASVCRPDADGFTDTPATLSTENQDYYPALIQICETWRLKRPWPTGKPWVASADFGKRALSSMSSCDPSDPDPVFNVMSYTSSACRSHYTAQQVQYMRNAIKAFRPEMYKAGLQKC